jgi:hypothetical protein
MSIKNVQQSRNPAALTWNGRGGAPAKVTGPKSDVLGALAQREARGEKAWSKLFGNTPFANLWTGRITTEKDVKARLRHADARVLPPGEKPARKSRHVTFSPEEMARVRNAPDMKSAQKAVKEILQQHTGKKGRDMLNKLLDTKIRSGPNKNRVSSRILDDMCGSIAKSLRQDSTHSSQSSQRSGARSTGAPYGATPHGDCPPPPPPHCVDQPVTVNLDEYVPAAKSAGELISPLVFDLQGRGLHIEKGERVGIDLDGDGQGEMVTNPDNGLGLLTFDALDVGDDERVAASRDFFGDGTDLTGYGVRAPRADGRWDDGFASLRALCEHMYLVHGEKQFLNEQDIAFLQDAVGLRMRVGGIHGEDRLLSELGITRIDLGELSRVVPLEQSAKDRFGNKWMHQPGATFVVQGETRGYADLWFAVTQRTSDHAASSPRSSQPRSSSVDAVVR